MFPDLDKVPIRHIINEVYLMKQLQMTSRPGVDFINMLLRLQIPKAQKDGQAVSDFLRFWDLRSKKLRIKYW